MKFYNDKNSDFYRIKILRNYLTSICCNNVQTSFFKNGENHNTKNAACCNSYYEFEMFYDLMPRKPPPLWRWMNWRSRLM